MKVFPSVFQVQLLRPYPTMQQPFLLPPAFLVSQLTMAIPHRLNKALDVVHKVTVAVLATSAVYFTVEIFRASWSIQEHKYDARMEAKQQQQEGASGSSPARP